MPGAEVAGSLDGIVVNDDLQPFGEDGAPIEGMHVVDNDQGGFYAGTYFPLAVGINAGRCATFGRMVGKCLRKRDNAHSSVYPAASESTLAITLKSIPCCVAEIGYRESFPPQCVYMPENRIVYWCDLIALQRYTGAT